MPYMVPSRGSRRRAAQVGRPVPINTRISRVYAGSRRYGRRLVGRGGPPGTTRRYASKVVREMPVYAPPAFRPPEMHYFDVALGTLAGDTTGAVTLINGVGGGDTVITRQGSRINMAGCQIRGSVSAGSAGTIAQGCMVLVYDRQTSGAAPAITDVYESVSSTAFQTTFQRSRFAILGRWVYTLIGNTTTPAVGRESLTVDQKCVFNYQTVFNESGAGTITNVVSGGLFLLTFGNVAAGTGAATFSLTTRVFFGDS